MNDMITLRGWVGTEPTMGLTKYNSPYSRFRMSVNDRRFDRERQVWVDGHTSWYNIQCYGLMAENIAESVRKGQRVIVMGRLQVRSFEKADGTTGTEADIVASSVGHDLALGIGRWNRRRDEDAGASLARRSTTVEGIGVVNPVTGELEEDVAAHEAFLVESAELEAGGEDGPTAPGEHLLSA
jgi:single-strand DNA-binding protein